MEIFSTSAGLKVTAATDSDSHSGPFPQDLFSSASFGGSLASKICPSDPERDVKSP